MGMLLHVKKTKLQTSWNLPKIIQTRVQQTKIRITGFSGTRNSHES